MILLAASLLMAEPAPLDMPRASAYLVREGDSTRLEDRFNKTDLWVSQSVDGRWVDEDGRIFVLSHLDALPPQEGAADAVVTRTEYAAGLTKIDRRDKRSVREAIAALSPVDTPEKESRPRQMPRGYRDVDYWHGTNRSAVVCAFLPEKSQVWRLASWQLAEGDDFSAALETFEKEFLEKRNGRRWSWENDAEEGRKTCNGERELLRRDARHSVAMYENWRVTDGAEFTILDDMQGVSDFTVALTNDLCTMRLKYAETLPTEIDGSNVLCVARIFANREEYLDALETSGISNMTWSAAYWCQNRRELVAYLPEGGFDQLVKTIRHEAFHQYLSYATSMIQTSPWLNEGYAQYFEIGAQDAELRLNKCDWGAENFSPEELERLSKMLPSLMAMDYEEFYSGTDEERRLKYNLALSIAQFIEHGARNVRFRPFKDLKPRYFKSLFETKDMRRATSDAFGSADNLRLFVAEWLKYWKNT